MDIFWNYTFRVTMELKIREFQYKVLNNIVFTNEKLFRFGLAQSPSCTFCQEESESLEHALFLCKFSFEFWKHVLSWLKDKNIQIESIILTELIFGKFEIEEDLSLINHILLLGKYHLCTRKCNGKLPSLNGFTARLKRVLSIKLYIARRRNKLISHHKKWGKLLTTLTDQ